MDELLAAYKTWWGMPFPEGGTRDDLNDLHGDLHVVFEWVLSTVEPFVEREVIVSTKVDIGAGLHNLRSRLAALRGDLSGDDASLADQYLAYLEALDTVYAAFQSVMATQ